MILQVRDFRLSVGDFHAELPLLELSTGEIAALMGPSGSGKSTLLQGLAGFLPAAGHLEIDGRELAGLPPEQRRIALVFQRGALFPHLNVFQNIEFGLKVQHVPAPARALRVGEWIGRLGLAGLEQRFPHQISGGQAQRVALARALIVGFPIVLLDEPFSALDLSLRQEMRHLLRRLVKETQVAAILVTHDPEDVRAVADRLLLLESGRVHWQGTVDAAREKRLL